MKSVKRNGKIELMRFVMCIFVIIYHAEDSINFNHLPRFFDLITLSKHGCIGVEFFFVLSGFFMAKAAEKDYLSKLHRGVNDTVNFFFSLMMTLSDQMEYLHCSRHLKLIQLSQSSVWV